jgi:hypothetical protein
VAAPGREAGQGRRARRRTAQRVEGDVDGAAGRRAHSRRRLERLLADLGPDGDVGAGGDGQVEGLLPDVDGDHPGTGCSADHHCGQAHAAAAVDGDPLPRHDPADLEDGTEGRREPAPERGGGHRVDGVRQGDEVDAGVVHHDELGERSPTAEARLGLVGAHLVVSGQALPAPPAGVDERRRHPLTRVPALDAITDGGHDPGEFVPRHVRQGHVEVVAGQHVPVASAQARGLHPDDDAVRRAGGIGHLADDGAHLCPSDPRRR